MKLTCRISNQNTNDFPNVVIRNLYQVVFWDANFRTFEIYTALACGALASSDELENPGARQTLNNQFGIRIDFSSSIDDFIETIDHVSQHGAIPSNFEAFRPVWGSESELMREPNDYIKYATLIDAGKAEDRVDSNYVFLRDPKKSDLVPALCKIVESKKDPSRPSKWFSIDPGDKELPTNIEIISFTKTTIVFKKNQISEKSDWNYVLRFADTHNFHCFDNSIYFVMPDGFTCKNPTVSTGGSERTIPNAFQEPSKDDNIYLPEWKEKNIHNRSYLRVTEISLKRFSKNIKEIKFSFKIESKINKLIKDFIYALVVSLFFSYCLDQTRIAAVRELFPFGNLVIPDVVFTANFAMLTLSTVFKINISYKKEHRLVHFFRIIGIVSSSIWFLVTYIIFPSAAQSPCSIVASGFSILNGIVLAQWLGAISLVSNLIALGFLWFFHNEEINLSFKGHIFHLFYRQNLS